MTTITTSLIIPAYNEAKTINRVIQTALKSKVFDEIICVDDGSTDNTADKILSFNSVSLIQLKQNRGKAYAVVEGIKRAKGKYIILCDGDLIKVKARHFQGLVKPLINDIADHVIAIRETDFPLMKQLSGERGFKKADVEPYLDEIKNIGYGLETFLNNLFKKKRTYWFWYPGLVQSGKTNGDWLKKLILIDSYLQEGYEITREIIRQKRKPLKSQLKQTLKRYIQIKNKIKKLSLFFNSLDQ